MTQDHTFDIDLFGWNWLGGNAFYLGLIHPSLLSLLVETTIDIASALGMNALKMNPAGVGEMVPFKSYRT